MAELLPARPDGGVWTVAGLVGAVASLLDYGFAACTVAGEVSGWSRASSGHCYFNLKDAAGGASLRCAMFRRASTFLDFAPGDGQAVQVRGRLAVYEPRGELQFVVEAMQQAGAGALYERFLRLRARLQAEGLFELAHKRPLPPYPATVGVVTSLGGAALHDVTTTLARRSPHVAVVVYPSVVQGHDAPAALCQAISAAGHRAEVDVLVVCRGGGSLEDLWAFNDERVVRAIRAAPMAVISGVGHETDVTLADLAADVRAATPTAAAELAAPATATERQSLDAVDAAMVRRALVSLDMQAQRLDRLALRLARPSVAVHRRVQLLDAIAHRLASAPVRAIAARHAGVATTSRRLRHAAAVVTAGFGSRLERAALQLHSLDPDRVLARGYALLTDRDGQALGRVAELAVGSEVVARLADGEALLDVRSTTPRPSA